MAQGVNVRLSGSLKEFLDDQIAPEGLYESASEYVGTLIRKDYERIEARRWSPLVSELKPGVSAAPSEFREVSVIIGLHDALHAGRKKSGLA